MEAEEQAALPYGLSASGIATDSLTGAERAGRGEHTVGENTVGENTVTVGADFSPHDEPDESTKATGDDAGIVWPSERQSRSKIMEGETPFNQENVPDFDEEAQR